MKKKQIGKIKNFIFDEKTNNLEITLIITDNKFKKKIIRDFSLRGDLSFDGDLVMYNANIEGKENG